MLKASDTSTPGPPRRRRKPQNPLTPFVPGIVLIFIGIVLFWCSTRRTVSPKAREFLEGQASIVIPAGVAALGVGAWQQKRNGNGK